MPQRALRIHLTLQTDSKKDLEMYKVKYRIEKITINYYEKRKKLYKLNFDHNKSSNKWNKQTVSTKIGHIYQQYKNELLINNKL